MVLHEIQPQGFKTGVSLEGRQITRSFPCTMNIVGLIGSLLLHLLFGFLFTTSEVTLCNLLLIYTLLRMAL
jgi:hypothetical protein